MYDNVPDNPPKKNGCFISFCLFLASASALAIAAWWLLRSTAYA